jgi:hypothetical protein
LLPFAACGVQYATTTPFAKVFFPHAVARSTLKAVFHKRSTVKKKIY